MVPESAFEIQNLLAFVSSVLCGFSIALAIGLLQLKAEQNLIKWITGLAIISSIVLIFATVTATFGAIWIAERPKLEELNLTKTPVPVLTSFRWSGTSFLIGILLLLSSIGLSGFIRTKILGWLTSVISVIVIIQLFYFLISIVDII